MKKARELSVLCDVDLALIVFSARGRLYEFCSGNSLRKIIEWYLQIRCDAEANVGSSSREAKIGFCKISTLPSSRSIGLSHGQALTFFEWLKLKSQVEGPTIEQLSSSELSQLEQKLNAMLRQTRRQKKRLMMESLACLQERERQLKSKKQLMEKTITEARISDALQHEDLDMEQPVHDQNVLLQFL